MKSPLQLYFISVQIGSGQWHKAMPTGEKKCLDRIIVNEKTVQQTVKKKYIKAYIKAIYC